MLTARKEVRTPKQGSVLNALCTFGKTTSECIMAICQTSPFVHCEEGAENAQAGFCVKCTLHLTDSVLFPCFTGFSHIFYIFFLLLVVSRSQAL